MKKKMIPDWAKSSKIIDRDFDVSLLPFSIRNSPEISNIEDLKEILEQIRYLDLDKYPELHCLPNYWANQRGKRASDKGKCTAHSSVP